MGKPEDDPFYLLSNSDWTVAIETDDYDENEVLNFTENKSSDMPETPSFFESLSTETPNNPNPMNGNNSGNQLVDNELSDFAAGENSANTGLINSENYNFEEESKFQSEVVNTEKTEQEFQDPLSALFGLGGPQYDKPTAMAEDFAKTGQNITASLQNIKDQSNLIQELAYPGGGDRILSQTGEYSYLQKLRDKVLDTRNQVKNSPQDSERVKMKLSHLKAKIEKEKNQYAKWETKSKGWALFFQVLTAGLAAIVTILLGIELSSVILGWWIKTICLIISAFISIIGIIARFYDADEKYAKYMDTSYKMAQLLNLIEYIELDAEYISLADANEIFKEVERILDSTYEFEMVLTANNDQTSNKIKQQGMAKM
jgi:hypothetical protein